MRSALPLLVVALGCSAARPDPAAAPVEGDVSLRRHKVKVTHLFRDPDRRYAIAPGILCSWNRDRHLHFFSSSAPEVMDVAFLDSAGRVVEIRTLAASNDVGLTSTSEARHALFLAAGAAKDDGLAPGDRVGFSPSITDVKPETMPVVKVAGHAVHVETAHLLSERQRGLMHRPRMSKDDGMLFLYAYEDDRSFWMMNTLIPLDIAYFDKDGTLLNVCRMKPAADPAMGGDLKAPSAAPARFVLEVNYGWFDARGMIDAAGKPVKPIKMEIPEHVKRLADQAE
jgi:uncharacterized membrane protein (UPF0127 family)